MQSESPRGAFRKVVAVTELLCADTYLFETDQVLPQPLRIAIVVRTAVVPAVPGRSRLGESLATASTEQLVPAAGVPVEFVVEVVVECPVAVATNAGH